MSKKFDNLKHGRDISKTIEALDLDTDIKADFDNLKENATSKDIISMTDKIKKSLNLKNEDKEILINFIKENYIKNFNFNNCPDNYEDLKQEAKFLSGMTQYSFLLMAQRLLKIKENRLYEKDKYKDFKSFIENEMNIERSTAYTYIDIITYFGVGALQHEDINYSKLRPVIPLLKMNDSNIPKNEIAKEYIEKAKKESFRDIVEETKELKIKYGLTKKTEKKTLLDEIKKQAEKLIENDIKELIKFLKGKIGEK